MESTSSNKDLQNSTEDINLKDIVLSYVFYWKWFLLSVIAFLAMAYFYLRKSPRIYNAEAKIQILDPTSGIELPSQSFVFKRSSINLENEVNAITSYPIVEKVVRELHLNYTFFAKGRIKTTEIKNFPLPFEYQDSISKKQFGSYTVDFKSKGMSITTNTDKILNFDNYNIGYNPNLPFKFINNLDDVSGLVNRTYIINIYPVKNTVLGLKNSFSVSQVGKTSSMLLISLTGESPRKSKAIINTLMKVYRQDGINDRQQVSKSTIDFIDNRFGLIENQLDSVEIAKAVFKKDNRLMDLREDVTFNLQSLKSVEEEISDMGTQIELTENIVSVLNEGVNDLQTLPVNILRGGTINNLIGQYNQSILDYNKLALNAGSNNPSLLYARDQLEINRVNMKKSLDDYLKDLKYSLKKLEQKKAKFRNIRTNLPSQEKESREIERQLEIKESLYLFLLQKREEAAINLAVTEPSIKVIEEALSLSSPIAPRPKIIYIGALLVGLLIPFGIIYVRFMLETKIHDKGDIYKANPNIPVIGEIPNIKNVEKSLFLNPNSNNVLAESFRILGSNANYILPKNDKGKVILCTSTIKGEGKTFVSINLSLSLSSINKKILLIGADLRNPQIHKTISLDKNRAGLSNYLYEDNFDWKSVLVKGFEKHKHHDILLSGAIPPNPTHLLTNGNLDRLIEEAKEEYDYIIIDSAPTILVTDTMLISHLADATIFVTRSDYTERKLLGYSKELSESNKIKNMAYVVNGVGSKKAYGYGYGYRYGYNYGYGYGYSSEEDN